METVMGQSLSNPVAKRRSFNDRSTARAWGERSNRYYGQGHARTTAAGRTPCSLATHIVIRSYLDDRSYVETRVTRDEWAQETARMAPRSHVLRAAASARA